MSFPLKSRPIPWRETPFFNMLYLAARGQGGPDPTIAWTSEFDWKPLQQFVQDCNKQNSHLISTAHVLVQAVGQALAKHPELNRRVVGRRVYQFKGCHVSLATRIPNENDVKVVQVHDADQKTVGQIACFVFNKQLGHLRKTSGECSDLARIRMVPGWLFRLGTRTLDWLDRILPIPVMGRVDRLRESVVLINDYSHPRFPVMRSYKASRHPNESKCISVTLGRAESQVEWDNGRPVAKWVAPLTVRIDHRIADGVQLGQFIKTLCDLLENPSLMQNNAGMENKGLKLVTNDDHDQPVRKAA